MQRITSRTRIPLSTLRLNGFITTIYRCRVHWTELLDAARGIGDDLRAVPVFYERLENRSNVLSTPGVASHLD
jgi:hypothetical protein